MDPCVCGRGAWTRDAGTAELALSVGCSWRVQFLVVRLESRVPGPAIIFRTVIWDIVILRIFLAWRKFRIDVVRVHQIRTHDH